MNEMIRLTWKAILKLGEKMEARGADSDEYLRMANVQQKLMKTLIDAELVLRNPKLLSLTSDEARKEKSSFVKWFEKAKKVKSLADAEGELQKT